MVTKFIAMNSKINKELCLNMCAVITGVVIYERLIKHRLPQKEQAVNKQNLSSKQLLLKAAQLPLSFKAYNSIEKILEEEWNGN